MGYASLLLILYYIIGCVFYSQYEYALTGDADICCVNDTTLQEGGCPGKQTYTVHIMQSSVRSAWHD
mgnify:CR=1 FL=1